jgi:hypothetical protein
MMRACRSVHTFALILHACNPVENSKNLENGKVDWAPHMDSDLTLTTEQIWMLNDMELIGGTQTLKQTQLTMRNY